MNIANSIYILLNEAMDSSRDTNDESAQLDAGYFETSIAKLRAGERLSENESQVVIDEIENELAKLESNDLNGGLLAGDKTYRRELRSALKQLAHEGDIP